MKLVWIVTSALLALVSTLAPVEAQNCGARVRKDWDDLTVTEKNTYMGALAAAMDSGAYGKFIEIHTEMQSEMAAHRQCMFIYWHRMLLVVFENMLRGQGAQFACVTVPYYNWLGANNRLLAGTCSSMGDCSSITSELGGYLTGRQRTVNINGVSNSGRCVNQYPLSHFCQSGTMSGSACAQCIPRGSWGSASIPASTSLASVRQQLFSGESIGQMSPTIERGCHNSIHSSLSGTMSTFAAPADPIFWSHHAMVDALHTIFYKCRVGTQRLTFAQKAAHTAAWTSCAKRDGGSFNPTDSIVMRTGVNGRNPVSGSQDRLIGRYFSGVPNQYAGLMDIRDLGDSSYSYELSGQLADMYDECDGTQAPAPAPAPAPTPTPAAPTTRPSTPSSPTVTSPRSTTAAPPIVPPAPAPVNNRPAPPAPQPPARWGFMDWLRNRWGGRGRRLEAQHGWWLGNLFGGQRQNYYDDTKEVKDYDTPAATHAPTPAPTPMPTPMPTSPQYNTNNNTNVDVVIVKKSCAEEELVNKWYSEVVANMGGQCPMVIADLERQACMFENQCLGGTSGYSAAFQATWGVKEPRCLTIVNAIRSGQQKIKYENWRSTMESYFGCPNPASVTQSTGAYGDAVQAATGVLSNVVNTFAG